MNSAVVESRPLIPLVDSTEEIIVVNVSFAFRLWYFRISVIRLCIWTLQIVYHGDHDHEWPLTTSFKKFYAQPADSKFLSGKFVNRSMMKRKDERSLACDRETLYVLLLRRDIDYQLSTKSQL